LTMVDASGHETNRFNIVTVVDASGHETMRFNIMTVVEASGQLVCAVRLCIEAVVKTCGLVFLALKCKWCSVVLTVGVLSAVVMTVECNWLFFADDGSWNAVVNGLANLGLHFCDMLYSLGLSLRGLSLWGFRLLLNLILKISYDCTVGSECDLVTGTHTLTLFNKFVLLSLVDLLVIHRVFGIALMLHLNLSMAATLEFDIFLFGSLFEHHDLRFIPSNHFGMLFPERL